MTVITSASSSAILLDQQTYNYSPDIEQAGYSNSNNNYAKEVKIYPNPSAEKVFIETGEIQGSEIQVSIYTISGKLEYQKTTQYENKIEIDEMLLDKVV